MQFIKRKVSLFLTMILKMKINQQDRESVSTEASVCVFWWAENLWQFPGEMGKQQADSLFMHETQSCIKRTAHEMHCFSVSRACEGCHTKVWNVDPATLSEYPHARTYLHRRSDDHIQNVRAH